MTPHKGVAKTETPKGMNEIDIPSKKWVSMKWTPHNLLKNEVVSTHHKRCY